MTERTPGILGRGCYPDRNLCQFSSFSNRLAAKIVPRTYHGRTLQSRMDIGVQRSAHSILRRYTARALLTPFSGPDSAERRIVAPANALVARENQARFRRPVPG